MPLNGDGGRLNSGWRTETACQTPPPSCSPVSAFSQSVCVSVQSGGDSDGVGRLFIWSGGASSVWPTWPNRKLSCRTPREIRERQSTLTDDATMMKEKRERIVRKQRPSRRAAPRRAAFLTDQAISSRKREFCFKLSRDLRFSPSVSLLELVKVRSCRARVGGVIFGCNCEEFRRNVENFKFSQTLI